MLLDMLVDVATLFKPEADPGDPWGEQTQAPHALTRVRISEGSGSRSVDAQGMTGARRATLFFFASRSLYDGNYVAPPFAKGDKICRGTAADVPPNAWTVGGVITVEDACCVHHWEVSLV